MQARHVPSHSTGLTNPNQKAENMILKSTVILALAMSAMAGANVQAQTTRAAVKSEAIAAAASEPKGEMSTTNQDKGNKPMASTTTRAAVKADAKSARAAGEIATGEQSTPRQGKKPAVRSAGEKSRAQVKSEAADAAKTGGLSRGEQSVPGQDKGGAKP